MADQASFPYFERGIQNSQIIRQQNIRQDIPREENTTQNVNQSEEQSEIAQNTSQTVSREENINTSQYINVARFAPLNDTEMTGRGDEIQKGNTDKDRETCQDCGKTFARRQDLNRHRQSIHQNKVYKCFTCAKEFSTSSNLTRHKKACSGNKTKGYQCVDCHITCNTQAGLRQHVSTKHLQTQKPIKFHNCGNFFQDRRVLNTHKNTECPQKCLDGRTEGQNTEQEPRLPVLHPGLDVNATRDDSDLPSRVRCHQCGERFLDRAQWFAHSLQHVQIGEGGGLHPSPYNDDNAPWIRAHGVDEELKHLYTNFRLIILEKHREGSIEAMYNFPVDNTVTVEQLMAFVNAIYARQTTAFKLNLVIRHFSRGDKRITEVIPVPDSLWKETTFVRFFAS